MQRAVNQTRFFVVVVVAVVVVVVAFLMNVVSTGCDFGG